MYLVTKLLVNYDLKLVSIFLTNGELKVCSKSNGGWLVPLIQEPSEYWTSSVFKW